MRTSNAYLALSGTVLGVQLLPIAVHLGACDGLMVAPQQDHRFRESCRPIGELAISIDPTHVQGPLQAMRTPQGFCVKTRMIFDIQASCPE